MVKHTLMSNLVFYGFAVANSVAFILGERDIALKLTTAQMENGYAQYEDAVA